MISVSHIHRMKWEMSAYGKSSILLYSINKQPKGIDQQYALQRIKR